MGLHSLEVVFELVDLVLSGFRALHR
jgi:hypothetical protein